MVSGRVVKSVQYGFIDRTGQAIVASVTVSHSTVDISKSLIFIKGSSTYSDEGYDNIVVSRTSSNFVVKTSVPDTVKINGSLSWQVIEFY